MIAVPSIPNVELYLYVVWVDCDSTAFVTVMDVSCRHRHYDCGDEDEECATVMSLQHSVSLITVPSLFGGYSYYYA